jgi:predicted anti-sigma-YlaC factor YlaD
VTCKQVDEFLDDYLSGELPRATRMSFQVHLLVCSQCRKYLDSYRKTIALERATLQVEQTEPPKPLVNAIISAKLWKTESPDEHQ